MRPWLAVKLASLLASCSYTPPALNGEASEDASETPGDSDPPRTNFVRRIDLVDAEVAGGPHVEFPLLVALSESWLRTIAAGGDVANPSGFDIVFSANQAGTARLAHELELYRGDTGDLVVWVKIPMLTPDTVLYIHYNDPEITASQEAVGEVWSNAYAGVWHLGGSLRDSTARSADAVNTGATDGVGQIAAARAFDAIDDQIDAGSSADVDDVFVGGGTAEAWLFPTGFGESNFGRIFDKGHLSGWSMGVNNNNVATSLFFVHGTNTGSYGHWNTPPMTMPLNSWTHVVVVYDQGTVANDATIYLDGVAMQANDVVVPAGAIVPDASHTLTIGNRTTLDRTFAGSLDELRLSRTVRSPDWIVTAFRNQATPSSFYAVSSEL